MTQTSTQIETDNQEFDRLLKTGTRQELLDLRQDIIDKQGRTKQEITLAKRTAWATRHAEIADPRWLTRAEGFVRMMGARVIRIQNRLSEMAAAQKEDNIAVSAVKTMIDSALFVEHAKRVLDRETYLSIWDSVDRARRLER